MQARVPQFIDIPDKIFGPFTFKQFIYLAGGGGIAFVLYKAFPFVVAVIPILIVLTLSIMLTFYKINNQSFIEILQAAIKFQTQGKLYIWKKSGKKKAPVTVTAKKDESIVIPRLTSNKLDDLSWSLNILDSNREL